MKNWIVVDLDGTLFDHTHRFHMFQSKDYDDYHNALMGDKLHDHIVMIIKGFLKLRPENNALIVTGRPEAYRSRTIVKLETHGIGHLFEALLMREEKDWDPDDKLKPKLVREYFGTAFAAQEEIAFVLEDREKVVTAYRDLGFKCLQVAQGDF